MRERTRALALPAGLAFVAWAELVFLGDGRAGLAELAVAPFVVVPLLARRRHPLAALGATGAFYVLAVAAGLSLYVEVGALFAALLVAIYFASVRATPRRAAVAWLLGSLAETGALLLAGDDDGFFLVATGMFVVPALAGQAVRRQSEQAERLRDLAERLDRERESNARLAVLAERNRIARELHDVLAHSLSVMVVQADGGRHQVGQDADAERRAFESIEATGREALTESRRLLGVLREAGGQSPLDPQPGLANLDALVERTRAAGLATEYIVEGERRELSPGLDLAAYRIVQEALTNSLRHSGAEHARVRVAFDRDAVELDLSDDGDGLGAGNGGGHGLTGMRERASLYGGKLDAGAAPGGGFRVHVRLPTGR